MFKKLIHFSVHKPKVIMFWVVLMVILSLIQFPRMKIDTDPENMLPEDEFVRIFNNQVKKEFAIYDFIVLGVVNEKDVNGVFNPKTLNAVYAITEKIKGIEGVISREIIALSTKDNIRQGQIGEVVFEWLMKQPIDTQEQAEFIRDEAKDNPMFNGTIVSEDGRAVCVYIPIAKKDISYRVAQEISGIVKDLKGNENYYITGLPVAQDTFGIEMFKQMAMSAPLAGLVIFILMWIFFKSIRLIIAPMLVAIVTVLSTMGLLIGFGFPVHIMSSMIPIFLMPIAVLDSVHILSVFFDKYKSVGNKQETVFVVMDELFTSMLYTSLTSAVGFYSLSFSSIPPVQAFGIFVACGVMIAWVLTITFIPAYIALMDEKSFAKIRSGNAVKEEETPPGLIDVILTKMQKISILHYKMVLIVSLIVVILSIYGISKISVNDNPVRWFDKNHNIRVSDRILNKHFAGTYTAYLVLDSENQDAQVFLEPEMLKYVEGLQKYLLDKGMVGKSTALPDVVKKVYSELLGGDKANYLIPETKQAVAQCLISYENSHKPDDLWHMATPDYSKINIWIQLRSGDNKDMSVVLDQVDDYLKNNSSPFKISYNWAGLTYINVIWQNKMVSGMLMNFLGSFVIIFFMMTFLFSSPILGLISMVPLTITILLIYSLLGFVGKDYDMPVAVLSALTLGLSVDFAIHFLQRARDIFAKNNSWQETSREMFKGPARAITLNALVIALGFLPLLFAPLIPYRTVGFFMFAIMFVSSISTLFILPAIISVFEKVLFVVPKKSLVCNCRYCVIIGIAVAVTVMYILRGYTAISWGPSIFISIAVMGVMSAVCAQVSKHKFCIVDKKQEENQ